LSIGLSLRRDVWHSAFTGFVDPVCQTRLAGANTCISRHWDEMKNLIEPIEYGKARLRFRGRLGARIVHDQAFRRAVVRGDNGRERYDRDHWPWCPQHSRRWFAPGQPARRAAPDWLQSPTPSDIRALISGILRSPGSWNVVEQWRRRDGPERLSPPPAGQVFCPGRWLNAYAWWARQPARWPGAFEADPRTSLHQLQKRAAR